VRILCLDGGGIRGVFSAYILMKMEQEMKRPVRELFDMVAGTSTGSILASAVVLGMDMTEIVHLFQSCGKRVFDRKSKLGILNSFYDNESLKVILKKEFGDVTLGDIKYPLIIPSVDISAGSIHVFRSKYAPEFNINEHVRVYDAVLSSCSAPLYFPPYPIQNTYLAADGGLWANNPSLVCLTDALHHFEKGIDETKILSIGTGKQRITFNQKSRDTLWGLSKWIRIKLSPFKITPKLIDLALNLSSESISYHCQILCKENYLRINADLGKEVPFDELTYMDELVAMADEVYKQQRDRIYHFFEGDPSTTM
jgi:patatin-like phospholipase/acyl hydrolase